MFIADNIEQYNVSPSPATSLGITSEVHVTPLIRNFIFFGRRHHMSSYYYDSSILPFLFSGCRAGAIARFARIPYPAPYIFSPRIFAFGPAYRVS